MLFYSSARLARRVTRRTLSSVMRHLASPICAVLIHVADWREGLAWYSRAFPGARSIGPLADGWACLEVDGVQVEIVPADQKVASGAAGTVVYWSVPDLDARVAHLRSIGAELYRGPMAIEAGLFMCQFKDPFGNLLGLRGPRPRGDGDA
jgi:predicted enzyme related to lactoylglutathione lyase